jgi:uncharacterized tellurite resistance protein B-like protein
MSLLEFRNILSVFRGKELGEEEKKELFKEAALMTLARATSADTNVKAAEVETVQRILEELTGEHFSTADIRVAAGSEVFERTPLHKYLASVGKKLDRIDRGRIICSLADVIKSDERISPFETQFFDMVVDALGATPSEIMGLIAEGD